jgi:hypothetical protein
MASVYSSAAWAGNQPIFCQSTGGKTWYFALGKTVFEIDRDNFSKGLPQVADVNPTFALSPPDSKVALGCNENPQQIETFSILNWPRLKSIKAGVNLPPEPILLELYRYPALGNTSPLIDPEIERLKIAAIKCQNKPFLQRWDDGTFLCAEKSGLLNPLLETGSHRYGVAWEFIISGKLYLTPLGQNLIMSEDQIGVDANYLLSPDISVHYTWIPPKTASDINPAYIIEVDKAFELVMSSFLVTHFQWPLMQSNH